NLIALCSPLIASMMTLSPASRAAGGNLGCAYGDEAAQCASVLLADASSPPAGLECVYVNQRVDNDYGMHVVRPGHNTSPTRTCVYTADVVQKEYPIHVWRGISASR